MSKSYYAVRAGNPLWSRFELYRVTKGADEYDYLVTAVDARSDEVKTRARLETWAVDWAVYDADCTDLSSVATHWEGEVLYISIP